MCLDSVDQITKQAKIGYKVVYRISKTATKTFYTSFRGKRIQLNRQYVDENRLAIKEKHVSYTAGFHVWRRLCDAKHFAKEFGEIVLKVELDSIVASGRQERCDVLVARKMKPIQVVASYA